MKIILPYVKQMRIIFVPGIKTYDFYLNGWRKDLAKNFSGIEAVFLNDIFYMWWQINKLEQIIDNGLALLNDGKPTLLLAHSFGGILAKTMIDRATTANITGLVTMCSPHHMNYLGVQRTKNKLKTPLTVPVPTYTFGGYLDPVVPYKYTSFKDTPHTNLWCEHLSYLLLPNVRKKVIEMLKERLKN